MKANIPVSWPKCLFIALFLISSLTAQSQSEPEIITQDVTLQLDQNGSATLTAEQVDAGSNDPDGPVTISIDKTDFDCDDIGDFSSAIPIEFVGSKVQTTYGWGAGYNPIKKEYWYPEWPNSDIHKLNTNREYIGSFDANLYRMMQVWMDMDSDEDYYAVPYVGHTITKRNGSSVIWSYYLGTDARALTTDKQYLYVLHGGETNDLVVLDKQDGSFVKRILLPGFLSSYGCMAYANGNIYVAGGAWNWSPYPNIASVIHIIDAADGSYKEAFKIDINPKNMSFDGETMWLSEDFNTIYGYKISEGNAYSSSELSQVTFTATDPLGNSASKAVNIAVEDNLSPSIVLNGNAVISLVLGEAFNDPGAAALDNCSAIVQVGGDVLDVNTPGTYTLTYQAIDGSGNTSETLVRTVHVVESDVTPPVLTGVPNNVTVECDAVPAPAVVTANDDVDGEVAVDFQEERTDGDCPGQYSLTRTFSAVDASGNSVSQTQSITVIDTTPPEISGLPTTLEVNTDDGTCDAIVDYPEITVTDACGDITFTYSIASGSVFEIGQTTVIITAVDQCGNESLSSFIVDVQDNTPPVAIAQDVIVQLDEDGNGSITAELVDNGSTDACGEHNLALSKTAFDCSHIGDNEVILTVTDINGNVSSTTANVEVQDILPPEIIVQEVTVQLDQNGQATLTAEQLDNGTHDACGPVSISIDNSEFDCYNTEGESSEVPPEYVDRIKFPIPNQAGGYNPLKDEFWIPEVKGTYIQRLDANGEYLGRFDSGEEYIWQLWMDKDSDEDYYTANSDITKRNGSNVIWRYREILVHFMALTTNQQYLYALVYNSDYIVVLNKHDGSFIRNIQLPGKILWCRGSMVYANGNIYMAGSAQDWSDYPNDDGVIHVLDATDGSYKTSYPIDKSTNYVSFDGEVMWFRGVWNTQNGYKISDGDAYVNSNTVVFTATDQHGNSASKTVTVTVENNNAPTAIAKDISVSLDSDGLATISANDVDDGSYRPCGDPIYLSVSPSSFTCDNLGPNRVTLSVTDDKGNVSTASATVTVIKDPPNISFEMPELPRANTTVNAEATFTGSNVVSASFFWGDGTSSEATINEGVIESSHIYQKAGTYNVTLATTDECGLRSYVYDELVVFDPRAGILSAKGSIWSNPGAYLYDPTKEGKADFKLDAEYKEVKKKGKNARKSKKEKEYELKGKTEFKFKNGNLKFKSTSYDWLVVTDEKTTLQGMGKIGKKKGYQFVMSLVPGEDKKDNDKFRFIIWTDDVIVYDNQRGTDEDAEVIAEVTKGKVDIKKSKVKKDKSNDEVRISAGPVFEKEVKEARIEVYPNPFKNSFTINYVGNRDSREVKLTILDLSGKTIYQKSYDPEIHQEYIIDFEGRPMQGGVYFIHLDDGIQKKIFKMIKL